jgi:hypothetical protein
LPPTNSTQSVQDCNNNIYQCGWTDYQERFSENVYFGNDINNNLAPSLLINNNSVVLGYSESFSGIYFEEDVNYISPSVFGGGISEWFSCKKLPS